MSQSEALDQTSEAEKKDSTYQCPKDFMAFSYDFSEKALREEDKQKELWLIKVPARFDPKSFEGLKLSLSGLKMVQSRGTTPQSYSVFGSRTAPSDLHLLASKGKKRKPFLCSSGFSGVLKISESYGNCSENQVPIPAAPAPCIPAGLKQRFQPFGSSIAAKMVDEVTVVPRTAPKRTSRPDPNEGEERKKKKKTKKDKRDSEAFIKQEPTQVDCDQLESTELMEEEPMEERRKKKKNKKDKRDSEAFIKQEQTQIECDRLTSFEPMEERRKKKKVNKEKERLSEDTVDESLIYKTEPLDASYDYQDTPGKTKKKKKKSSRHE